MNEPLYGPAAAYTFATIYNSGAGGGGIVGARITEGDTSGTRVTEGDAGTVIRQVEGTP